MYPNAQPVVVDFNKLDFSDFKGISGFSKVLVRQFGGVVNGCYLALAAS